MTSDARNQYVPDQALPPGETLKALLEERAMSQAELALRMGRTPKMVNELIAGKAPLTQATALLLEQVLGVPARLWNNLEMQYREDLARIDKRQTLRGYLPWLKTIPLRAMIKQAWIPRREDKIDQLIEALNFFGIATPEQLEGLWLASQAVFRQSPAFEANPIAVAAWLRKGELEAQQRVCAPYEKEAFQAALREIRDLTREPPAVFQQQMIALCAEAGVALVFVPALPKTCASGATRWLSQDKVMLELSLRYKTDDQLWFSFFHEAGHIVRHGKRQVFVDDDQGLKKNDAEQEADRFAADFLIPPEAWSGFVSAPRVHYSTDEIVAFADRMGIAPGIVVGRLQHEGRLEYGNGNRLKRRLRWEMREDTVAIVES